MDLPQEAEGYLTAACGANTVGEFIYKLSSQSLSQSRMGLASAAADTETGPYVFVIQALNGLIAAAETCPPSEQSDAFLSQSTPIVAPPSAARPRSLSDSGRQAHGFSSSRTLWV